MQPIRQGKRFKLRDEVKQEIIVHRGAKTLLAQAAFGGGALEQVERNRAQHRHVLSTLLVAGTGRSLLKVTSLKRQQVGQVAEAFFQTERGLVVHGALRFAPLSPFRHFETIALTCSAAGLFWMVR